MPLQNVTLLSQTLLGEEICGEVPGGGPALVTRHLTIKIIMVTINKTKHYRLCLRERELREQLGERIEDLRQKDDAIPMLYL